MKGEKMKVKATEFTKGYICALSCIFNGHGGGVIIDEALRAIAAEVINPKSIDEFDRPMLIKYQKDGAT
jgi:hypothetical protein